MIAHPQPANICNDVYSISKNFTATAAGILYDRNILSFDETVYDIFKDNYPGIENGWKNVTVKNLLTQTTGISKGFLDIDVDDIHSYGTDDFLKIVLSAPFVYKPGQNMVYSDSNYYLLSRIVSQKANIEMCDFLQHELFTPLKFQGHAWAKCPQGYSMGATGLFLRTEDLLKLGILYLNRGIWNGQRILSENFINDASSNQIAVCKGTHYGYSFWRNTETTDYYGNGMFGQLLHISPQKNRVVAWTAYDKYGQTKKLAALL